MEELELGEERTAALAATLEDAARALAAVRYGSVARLGAAWVVLNPDSPLDTSNVAAGFTGSPGAVEATLQLLPEVFAEAGRSSVVVLSSPSSVPELELLVEELEFEAVEETGVLLLTDPTALLEGEPGRVTRPLPERDEERLAPLLGDALGWPAAVTRRQQVPLGHRLDDARHSAFGAWEGGELVGVSTAFRVGAVGQVVEVAVAAGHRGRSTGRALASAAAASLLLTGAELVWTTAETGSRVERFFTGLGFTPVYDATTYVLPL